MSCARQSRFLFGNPRGDRALAYPCNIALAIFSMGVVLLAPGCSENDDPAGATQMPSDPVTGDDGAVGGGSSGETNAGTNGSTGGSSDAGTTPPVVDGGTTPADAGTMVDASAPVDASTPTHEHCGEPYAVDPRDSTTTSAPEEWKSTSGAVDLAVPVNVRTWMEERRWQGGHDAWHNVRRCSMRMGGGGGADTSICTTRPDLVSAHQECSDAEDGYVFLVMHRHMIEGLKQAFPKNAALFAPFPEFPYDAADVPEQWRARFGTGWSADVLEAAQLLEQIEMHVSEFATEGDLGKYIQCGPMNGRAGVHGALHSKWSVNDSPYVLGNSKSNVDNYMFWKLHGWIDKIWERYRVAKGLTPDEAKLKQALIQQCEEMHTLGQVVDGTGDTDAGTLPVEHGYFHENVRPILEQQCKGCHGASNPEGQLSLGGNISSADVVSGLINVGSVRGGQFKLVVPSNPEQSWLYLKASGTAAQAGCTGTSCNAQVMPPTGQVTLTTAQLNTIKQWIADGAPVPTQ